jgi:hypothetical protein
MADEVEVIEADVERDDDVQWFKRGPEEHDQVGALAGSQLYNRLAKDPSWTPIDGFQGEETDLPVDETADLEAPLAEETPSSDAFPIEGYDDLTVEQVVPLLEDLTDEQLAVVEAHEVADKNRVGVLEAIEAQREANEADE